MSVFFITLKITRNEHFTDSKRIYKKQNLNKNIRVQWTFYIFFQKIDENKIGIICFRVTGFKMLITIGQKVINR